MKDDDGDGVPNTRDRCPATVTGAEVNAQGCELDTDGDGVVNRLDACPATAKGKAVDTKGCELPVVIRLEGVTFETGFARLTPASLTILDEVAETLRKNPDVRVEVAGHTDDRGRRDFNVKLSRQRAEAVRDYLVNKGIAADRLSARGYGPDQPAADNASAEGRVMNRRVELKILNP
ncbi:OmpA family protein [Hahella sp. SMD15-11]|uniref:OmpA family protein n=1 Tax=Thermohahella caldifontis TaxID=3142973 RepID=A0AB39UU43_9GAMM